MAKKLTIEDLEKAYNPFTANLQIPIYTKFIKGQFKKDELGNVITVNVDIEKTASCRLYITPSNRKHITNLSARAKELLMWIMYRVESNKDYLWINKKLYMEEACVKSINTYKDSFRELIKEGIFQFADVKDCYWINPNFFFNGNRVAKYPDNIIK